MNGILRMAAGLTLCATLSAPWVRAEDRVERKGPGKLWWASVAAVVAGSAVDAHSSWGRQELNPLLRGAGGEFGMKAVAIKAAITGGVVGVQYLLLKKNPGGARHAAIANFAMAGVFGGVAYYNHTNHRAFPSAAPPSRPAYLVAGPAAAE
jgi:hypothetical protein